MSAPLGDLTLNDLPDSRSLAAQAAAQAPLWKPGEAHAYHAITFGTIAQEIVRRTLGRELHEVFDDDIARPLGDDVSLRCSPEDLSRLTYIVTIASELAFRSPLL